jgi:hypothetical protein
MMAEMFWEFTLRALRVRRRGEAGISLSPVFLFSAGALAFSISEARRLGRVPLVEAGLLWEDGADDLTTSPTGNPGMNRW